ncbi:MAG: YhcG family protein [Pirellula sp.]
MAKRSAKNKLARNDDYRSLLKAISTLVEQSRRSTASVVNQVLAATYWQVGQYIVEHEQGGAHRAEYGTELVTRLSIDLKEQFGRGYSARNLRQMRAFFEGWEIWQTPSAKFSARVIVHRELTENIERRTDRGIIPGNCSTTTIKLGAQVPPSLSAEFDSSVLTAFPLSWSHYVRLMSVDKPFARAFYESEAIRGGWSVRQLDRQISTQFFERTSSSKQKVAMLARGQKPKPDDLISPDDEIRDPYLLEFLNLKDEYSENELEGALVNHLETFMLELGAGFTFVARQKRIRIGTEWYRIDLLLYHRRLKCLVVLDLKIGKYTHSDAGQMSLYLTYAREHLMEPGENEPVGIILCSDKDDAVVHYSIGSINARVFASKYMTELPDVKTLQREIEATKLALVHRQSLNKKPTRS